MSRDTSGPAVKSCENQFGTRNARARSGGGRGLVSALSGHAHLVRATPRTVFNCPREPVPLGLSVPVPFRAHAETRSTARHGYGTARQSYAYANGRRRTATAPPCGCPAPIRCGATAGPRRAAPRHFATTATQQLDRTAPARRPVAPPRSPFCFFWKAMMSITATARSAHCSSHKAAAPTPHCCSKKED